MSKTATDDRNWYKLATFVLSIITLVVAFTSGIYYKRVDLRNERLKRYDAQIDRLVARREKLAAIPKVSIRLLTLASSGLPEAAFSSLREVPAVLRIQHAGGTTAKGITVIIESSEPVTRILPNSSLENYAAHISEDRRTITVDLGQLRQKAIVDATIMTRGTTRLSYKATTSDGTIIDEEETRRTDRVGLERDALDYYRRRFDAALYRGYERDGSVGLAAEYDVDREIAETRAAIDAERERPLILPATSSLFPDVLIVVTAIAIVGALIWLAYEFRRGRAARRQGVVIRQVVSANALSTGGDADVVQKALGEPQGKTLQRSNGTGVEQWIYRPYNSIFFSPHPELVVEFTDGVVSKLAFKDDQDVEGKAAYFGVKLSAGWCLARRPGRLQHRQLHGVTSAAKSLPPSASLVAAAVAPLRFWRVKPAAAYTKDVL